MLTKTAMLLLPARCQSTVQYFYFENEPGQRTAARVGEACGVCQDRVEYASEVAVRSAHQVQHFRRSCLLVQGLVQFAGEPATAISWPALDKSECATALGASRFGFNALRRGALTGLLPALERLFIAFSVGSGERIVPGRRATPKVAYACSSNEPLRCLPLTQRLRLFQITRIKSLSQPAVDRQFVFPRAYPGRTGAARRS